MRKNLDEKSYTINLVDKLRPLFSGYELETGISIFYSLYIDEAGNIPINQNENGEPTRGKGTGFEQDILLYERVTGQTNIVPRVAVEMKFGGVTTHDALVYSEKARRLRYVYPYLRYGFLIGDVAILPPRLLRLGTDFDFILRMSNPPGDEEIKQFSSLLKEEIDTSKKLGQVFSRQTRVELLRRKIIIEPGFEASKQTTKTVIQTEVLNSGKSSIDSNQRSYYVYENWVADNKAMIHFENCPFCNYGKGTHGNSGTHNGRWLGPFSSFESARKAAKETGRQVKICGKCEPF